MTLSDQRSPSGSQADHRRRLEIAEEVLDRNDPDASPAFALRAAIQDGGLSLRIVTDERLEATKILDALF